MAGTARKWMRSSATVTVPETAEIDSALKTTLGRFVVAVWLTDAQAYSEPWSTRPPRGGFVSRSAASLESVVGFHRNRPHGIRRHFAVPKTVGQTADTMGIAGVVNGQRP
jgi:hypothetical protein